MDYGCIAKKLGHSYSADIHSMIGGYDYILHEVAEEDLDGFMRARDFKGINVTIPYKKDVLPYLDEIDPIAEKIGSVNTVVNRGGRLKGYNTDILGMKALLKHSGIDLSGRKVMILGTGGTSVMAQVMARDLGASEVIVVSRRPGSGVFTFDQAIKDHADSQVIINTTPVGMYPENYASPIALDRFTRLEAAVDAVFNPDRTLFCQSAEKLGVKSAGGLYMLVAQAVYASEFFRDLEIPKSEIDRIYCELHLNKLNIALTGMPACGKTTIGRKISEKLGREFIDLDTEIEKRAGMTIPEIFENGGEKDFRDIETEVLKEICKRNSLVISTGGGAILRDENVTALRMNCKVFFIDRDLGWLKPTSDRPTAGDCDAIRKRYDERIERYRETADEIIKPTESVENNADLVIERFRK